MSNIINIKKKEDTIRVIIADCKFEIDYYSIKTKRFFTDFLSDFTIPDYVISVTEEEIRNEYFTTHGQDFPVVDLNTGRTAFTYDCSPLELQIIHRKITEKLLLHDTLLIHGAVVVKDSQAFMFTAPSGIGKTTRVKLWLKEYGESYVLNGDKPFIRIMGSNVIVYGSPWCGKEKMGINSQSPLKAIYLLNRGDKDKIERIGFYDALSFLLQQTYCTNNSNTIYKTLKLLNLLCKNVKIYRYFSTPTPDSVRLAYEATMLV